MSLALVVDQSGGCLLIVYNQSGTIRASVPYQSIDTALRNVRAVFGVMDNDWEIVNQHVWFKNLRDFGNIPGKVMGGLP